MRAGEVDVRVDGAGLKVEPVAHDRLADRNGLLVVPPGGAVIRDEDLQQLRELDQR